MADRAIKSERMVNLTVHLPTPGIAGIHATSHSWPGRRPGWTFDANGDKTNRSSAPTPQVRGEIRITACGIVRLLGSARGGDARAPTPPSFLRMTTVAERGRPAGSKSRQLLTARAGGVGR